jgi:polyferredoxin
MDEDTSLGARFWLMIVLLAAGAVAAAALFMVIFGRLWYAWGLFGAFLALGAALMAFGWAYDRRQRRRRERLTA